MDSRFCAFKRGANKILRLKNAAKVQKKYDLWNGTNKGLPAQIALRNDRIIHGWSNQISNS
jgi:hypothetical protein